MLSICLALDALVTAQEIATHVPDVQPKKERSLDMKLLHPWFRQHLVPNVQPKIVLMGDSVLDNFVWLKDPAWHLRAFLEKELQDSKQFHDWTCVNLAVDETTTLDFLERDSKTHGWGFYEQKRQVAFPDRKSQDHYYFASRDRVMRQVENLRALKNVQQVVVSVGGNDLYLNPQIQAAVVKSVFNKVVDVNRDEMKQIIQETKERLLKCIQAVKSAIAPGTRVVMVIPYHPHYKFNLAQIRGAPGEVANWLQRFGLAQVVRPIVQCILEVALDEKCDVMDLSKTLDPTDVTHYGTEDPGKNNRLGIPWSGAEPSNKSIPFISRLILQLLKPLQEHQDGPMLIFGRGDHALELKLNQGVIDAYTFGPTGKKPVDIKRKTKPQASVVDWTAWEGFAHQFLSAYKGSSYGAINGSLRNADYGISYPSILLMYQGLFGTFATGKAIIQNYLTATYTQEEEIRALIRFFIYLVPKIPRLRLHPGQTLQESYPGRVFFRGLSGDAPLPWKYDLFQPGQELVETGLFSVSLALFISRRFSLADGFVFILRPHRDAKDLQCTDLLAYALENEIIFVPTVVLTIERKFQHEGTRYVMATIRQDLMITEDPLVGNERLKEKTKNLEKWKEFTILRVPDEYTRKNFEIPQTLQQEIDKI